MGADNRPPVCRHRANVIGLDPEPRVVRPLGFGRGVSSGADIDGLKLGTGGIDQPPVSDRATVVLKVRNESPDTSGVTSKVMGAAVNVQS